MIDRLNRVGPVVALTAGFYTLVLVAQFMRNGGDASAFYTGTDGAFFHQIALHPFDVDWIREHTDVGLYRHQRILYPLLGFALSFGRPEWAPYALIGVNFVCVLFMAYFAALLCRKAGAAPLAGLLVSLFPEFGYVLGHDHGDLVSSALFLGSLHYLTQGAVVRYSILGGLAVLARETLLPTYGLVAFSAFAFPQDPGPPRPKRWLTLLPPAAFLLLQAVLAVCWGAVPALTGGSNQFERIPFAGYAQCAQRFYSTFSGYSVILTLWFAAIGIAVFLFALHARRSTAPRAVKLAVLVHVAMAVFYSPTLACNGTRPFLEILLLSFMIVAAAPKSRFVRPALAGLLLVDSAWWGILLFR